MAEYFPKIKVKIESVKSLTCNLFIDGSSREVGSKVGIVFRSIGVISTI